MLFSTVIPKLSESPTFSARSQQTKFSQSNDSLYQTITSHFSPVPVYDDHSSDHSAPAGTWPNHANLPEGRRSGPVDRLSRRACPARRLFTDRRSWIGQGTTRPSNRPTIRQRPGNPGRHPPRRHDGRRTIRGGYGSPQHFQRSRRAERYAAGSLQDQRNHHGRKGPLTHHIMASIPNLIPYTRLSDQPADYERWKEAIDCRP